MRSCAFPLEVFSAVGAGLSPLAAGSRMKTTAEITLVHRPLLSPSAVWTTARVLHDVAAHFVLLLALVPVLVGIERNAQRGGQHGGGEVFAQVFGFLFAHSVAMMLGDVAVGMVSRDGQADAGADQAVGLIGGGFGQHDEGDLARLELGRPSLSGMILQLVG